MTKLGSNVRGFAGFTVLLATLGTNSVAHGEDLHTTFSEGNTRYAEGRYQDAAAHYREILEAGFFDPALAINLGNTAAKRGRFGEAIRWYELCLRISPGDDDAAVGLAFASKSLGEERAEREGGSAVLARHTFSESLVRVFTEPFLAIAFLIFHLLLAAISVIALRRSPLAKTLVAPLMVLWALCGFALAIKRDAFSPGEPLIVTEPAIELREAPDHRAQGRGKAFEGDRGWILSRFEGYLEVSMRDGERGWVPAAEVGSLRNPR